MWRREKTATPPGPPARGASRRKARAARLMRVDALVGAALRGERASGR
jgi:hypothetical protein